MRVTISPLSVLRTQASGRLRLMPDSLAVIGADVRACQLCKLSQTRTVGVPGEGSPNAEIMFIGEGPGFHEDQQGRPFVGAAANS